MTTKDTACANVRGNRSACSRACPRWKPEGRVRRVRVHNGLSFPEVRKLVEMATPAVADKSSAAAAAAKLATKSVHLNSELAWHFNEAKYHNNNNNNNNNMCVCVC